MFNRFLQAGGILGISVFLLLLVIGLATRTDVVNAAPNRADEPAKRVISVSGNGRVTAQPDQAVITIGSQVTAPTLGEATKQVNDTMTKVLEAIKAQGIDPKEIQTSSYSVSPITNYKEGAPPQVTGYQVMNIVTVQVKKIETVGQVLDAGMGAGANFLGGVTFGIADASSYEQDARTAAVKDAMQRAQTLAAAAGVKLGNVLSITESSSQVPPPVPYARTAADAAGAGPVETGSLDVTKTVNVTFEISE